MPPASGCPLTFLDVADSGVCIFEGFWNLDCGEEDLILSFTRLPDSEFVVFFTTDPELYIGAEIDSARRATLIGWDTSADFSDLHPLSGAAALGDAGEFLDIFVDIPDFAIDGCPFSDYGGTYVP